MRRLVLLRHAKSSWSDTELDDHDRPLAKRGLRDAPHMGQRLRQRGTHPDLIITSSAARASETAQLLAEQLPGDDITISVEPQLYLAGPNRIIRTAANQRDSIGELILIAHNPGLTELANLLLPSLRLANLPTAGVVAIDFACADWGGISECDVTLSYYDYPKNPHPATNRQQSNL